MYQINFTIDAYEILNVFIQFLMVVYAIGIIFGTIIYFQISVTNITKFICSALWTPIQYIIFVHFSIYIMIKFVLTHPLYTLEAIAAILKSIAK